AAAVIGGHASDCRAVAGRDIDREPQLVLPQPRVEPFHDDPGLHLDPPRLGIERDDPVHVFAAIEHQGARHGLAALRGAAAARQHRHPLLPRDRQRRRDVGAVLRHDDPERLDLIDRGVRRVTAAAEPVEQHLALQLAPQAPIADAPANEADIDAFKASVLAKLTLTIGKDGGAATPRDWFVATALALRDRVIHRWLAVNRVSHAEGRKRVYYLSLEFLIGRLFADVVENLRMTETVKAALGDLGVDLDRMRRAEPDAALGNGGLGRLAACMMESMAGLDIPARGYGIRYDHGLFRQVIRDGWQMEFAENWLSFGNPWEFARPEFTYDIHYGGRV